MEFRRRRVLIKPPSRQFDLKVQKHAKKTFVYKFVVQALEKVKPLLFLWLSLFDVGRMDRLRYMASPLELVDLHLLFTSLCRFLTFGDIENVGPSFLRCSWKQQYM